MNANRIASCIILAAVLASGCRSVRRGEPIQGALDTSDPAVARGQKVFARYCHSCHPGGEGGLGPALNDKPFPSFLMKTQVRLGLGTMPNFDRHTLPPDDLDDLMRYVLAQRRHDDRAAR